MDRTVRTFRIYGRGHDLLASSGLTSSTVSSPVCFAAASMTAVMSMEAKEVLDGITIWVSLIIPGSQAPSRLSYSAIGGKVVVGTLLSPCDATGLCNR
jgi:hypothetical protein